MAKKPKTTTRSYRLGLLAPSDVDDWLPLWDRLFHAHRAMCCGAREFGEFYLNLRGGLSASLALPIDGDVDEERRRLIQRGTRRVLALGWLSVEDVRGAENHPHRVREVKQGESLSNDLAKRLLLGILRDHKGISDEAELAKWASDCVQALTANIRSDAVIVNRALSFADWQNCVGGADAEAMPEQARRILFRMCGTRFASLTLPEDALIQDDDEAKVKEEISDSEAEGSGEAGAADEEAVEPSNASRGVYCDLFGGDPGPKIRREHEKRRFAAMLYEFLSPFATGKQVLVFPNREELALNPIPNRCNLTRSLSAQLQQ